MCNSTISQQTFYFRSVYDNIIPTTIENKPAGNKKLEKKKYNLKNTKKYI